MEAEKTPDRSSASWGTRKADGVHPSQSPKARNQDHQCLSPGEDGFLSSTSNQISLSRTFFFQTLKLDDAHLHWWGYFSLLSQMLMSSKNTFIDTSRKNILWTIGVCLSPPRLTYLKSSSTFFSAIFYINKTSNFTFTIKVLSSFSIRITEVSGKKTTIYLLDDFRIFLTATPASDLPQVWLLLPMTAYIASIVTQSLLLIEFYSLTFNGILNANRANFIFIGLLPLLLLIQRSSTHPSGSSYSLLHHVKLMACLPWLWQHSRL